MEQKTLQTLRIKPRLPKELKVESTLTYQRFLKRGCHVIPKLAIKFKDTTAMSSESFSLKALRKAKLLRLFKKLKFASKVDLSEFQVSNPKFYSSTFEYIAKKLSNVSDLSLYDNRERKTAYQGLMTSWPKYTKQLSRFSYEILMEGLDPYQRNPISVDKLITQLSKQMSFPTDYLRYVPRLKTLKVSFPFFQHNPCLDRIWKFEKYPVSLEKICFNQAMCSGNHLPSSSSIARFEKLRHLQIHPIHYSSIEFPRSVCDLISHARSQLEALSITFVEWFEIDSSAFKRFESLKSVKIKLSLFKYPNNLEILESFEECPLNEFCLRVHIKSDADVEKITNFVNKKKSLKSLKVHITKSELFESGNNHLDNLIQTIENLPQLTSLSLRYQTNQFGVFSKRSLLPKVDVSFRNLRTKEIPLKKLRISLNQHSYSTEELLCLLKLFQETSSSLEKLKFDIGECKPVNDREIEAVLGFVRSLENIRILKLLNLAVPTRQFFLALIEAIEPLKYLRVFCIGEVSGKVAKPFFAEGVERILLKPGVEKFYCKISDELKKAILMRCVNCPDRCVKRIREQIPHPKKGLHQIQMFFIDENNSTWKVNE